MVDPLSYFSFHDWCNKGCGMCYPVCGIVCFMLSDDDEDADDDVVSISESPRICFESPRICFESPRICFESPRICFEWRCNSWQTYDWYKQSRGMCYPVYGMVHIKEPLLLIGKNISCGGSRLYASSHRQDNTYHGLCYTSRGALAGTRNMAAVGFVSNYLCGLMLHN